MPNRKVWKPTLNQRDQMLQPKVGVHKIIIFVWDKEFVTKETICVIFNIKSITAGGTHGFSRDARTMDSSEFHPQPMAAAHSLDLQQLCPQFLCILYHLKKVGKDEIESVIKYFPKAGSAIYLSILMFTLMWWDPRWKRQKPVSAFSHCPLSSPLSRVYSLPRSRTGNSPLCHHLLLIWLLSQSHWSLFTQAAHYLRFIWTLGVI